MARYYLEWIVELKKKYAGVEFFGRDDKAKIAVGDKVAVSTVVCTNNKGIALVGDDVALLALDHDFQAANIVFSSTLRCNIQNEVSGSFFIRDDDAISMGVESALSNLPFGSNPACTNASAPTSKSFDAIRCNAL